MASIRLVNPKTDSEQIAAIYYPYVVNTAITFDTLPVEGRVFSDKITKSMTIYPWLVCEHNGELLGYASGGQFRDKNSFDWTVETTIYVKEAAQGLGIGTSLYKALINCLTIQNFNLCIGIITIPNPTSINLHESLGFKKEGTIKKAGFKLGRWHDIGLWVKQISKHNYNPSYPTKLLQIKNDQVYLNEIDAHSKLINI